MDANGKNNLFESEGDEESLNSHEQYDNPLGIELSTMSASDVLPSIAESIDESEMTSDSARSTTSARSDLTADTQSQVGGRNQSRSQQPSSNTATNKGGRPDRSRRVIASSKFDFRRSRDEVVADTRPTSEFPSGKQPVVDPSIPDNMDGVPVASKKVLAAKPGIFRDVKAKFKKTRKNKLRIFSPLLMLNLVDAVCKGDLEHLKDLLAENGAFNLNKLDKNNLALMHYAAMHNRDFIARELLKRGANIEVPNLDIKATPLHAAARMNSTDVAHVLLARCANVDRKTTTGMTPLHISARRGHIEMTTLLVRLGHADVTLPDAERTTALHYGAMSGNMAVCQLLVEYGADIRAKDINDMTPLMRAAMSGHVDLVNMFIDRAKKTGLSVEDYLVDEDNESNTSLHLAVSKRRTTVIQRLLDYDVDVNIPKANGMSPLHIAAMNGATATATQLIENGAFVGLQDAEGMTPLHRATLYNRVETMAYLIHEGAAVDELDNSGFTPLMCAAWKGHKPAGDLLITRGADTHVFDVHRKSPLHWAAEMDHFAFVEFLLENGGKALIDLVDIYEQTALHYAAESGNLEMIKLLIGHDVQGEVRDVLEKTPVHIAAQAGHVTCVEELLQQTPMLLNEDDKDGMTPLLTACYYGNQGAVRTLLKMGADVTNVNDDHRTALMLASANNHVETMSILIENNINLHAVDKEKNNALHLCCNAGHVAAANLLIRAGADQSTSNSGGFTPLELAIEKEHEEIAAAIIRSKDWRVAMQSKDEQMISPMKALIEKLPDVALLVMDRCVHKTYKDQQNTGFDVKYDYQYIDPGPDDESTKANGYRYFAVRTMCTYGREKLLAHELSQSILRRKWIRFGRIAYTVDVFLYVMFVCTITAYSLVAPVLFGDGYWDEANDKLADCPLFNFTKDPHLRNYVYYDPKTDGYWYVDPTSKYIGAAVLAYCVTIIIGELIEMYTVRLKYFTEVSNLIDWTTLITSIMFVFPPGRTPCFHNWNAGIISVFFVWMKFIMYLKGFKTTGLYVLMFFETLFSLIKAMMVYVMFVLAFTMTFNMLFFQFYRFSNLQQSFLSVMTMMLGELNKDEIFNETTYLVPYEVTSYVLFLLFIFLMPMVLNNLTIGIAVGDIEGIRKKAFIKRNAVQADYVYHIENKCPVWLQRFLYQPDHIMTIRKDRYNTILSILFPPEDAAVVEADDKSEPRNAEHVLEELQKQKASIATIQLMVKQQSDILRRLADKEGVSVNAQDIAALSALYERPAEEDDENDVNESMA